MPVLHTCSKRISAEAPPAFQARPRRRAISDQLRATHASTTQTVRRDVDLRCALASSRASLLGVPTGARHGTPGR